MVVGISVALITAGLLLVVLKRTGVPEIPIYLVAGVLLHLFSNLARGQGIIEHSLVETQLMRELASLGLAILVFYGTSGMLIDKRRETAIKSFKTVFWLSGVSLAVVTGASLMLGFGPFEAMLFGLAASVGSTLLDSGLVRERARENHIHGWLTENMNFYDNVLAIMVLTTAFAYISGLNAVLGLSFALTAIFASLSLREEFSKLMLYLTDRENELITLLGISTLIASVWLTERFGLTALTGVYVAGLLLVETELGFRVRERFDAVKDFFTALSFISIGYLLTVPSPRYILASLGIAIFALIARPMLAIQLLRLEGYDLRTSFMASLSYSQISEIVLFAALLMVPVSGAEPFDTLALVFAAGTIATHAVENREEWIFSRLFSDYELESEMSELPEEMTDHVIIAGYDRKTQGLERLIHRTVVVVDYDLEMVEEAEERGVPHLLADLDSDATWERLNVEGASTIVSAVDDRSLMEKMESLETDAERVLVSGDSDGVQDELRDLLRKALK